MNKTDLVKTSLVCLLSASTSYGAGFALYQGSAAGNADSTYGTAKGGEPGSMYLNPAAIQPSESVDGFAHSLGCSVTRKF